MENNQNQINENTIPQDDYESLTYEEVKAWFESQEKKIEELKAELQKAQITTQTVGCPPKYIPPHKQGDNCNGPSNQSNAPHNKFRNKYGQKNHLPHIPTQHMQPPHNQHYVPHHYTQFNNPMHQCQYPPNRPPQQYTTMIRQFDLEGFQLYPYPIDGSWRGLVPKFVWSNVIRAKDHLRSFNVLILDLDVPYEDLHMRLFMMSLTKEARDWFNSLATTFIDSLQIFQDIFLEQYGNQSAPDTALHELTRIQKNPNDSIFYFNRRFNKLQTKIPLGSRLLHSIALSIYLNAFDPKTGYELRNRFPRDLVEAQKIAMAIENNRKAASIISKRDNPRACQQRNNYQYK